MEILGAILILAGVLVGLVYGIILLVKAFKTSIWWGLAYLFIPFAALVFVIVHWQVAKKPFLMSLISIPLILIGLLLSPETMTGQDLPMPQ